MVSLVIKSRNECIILEEYSRSEEEKPQIQILKSKVFADDEIDLRIKFDVAHFAPCFLTEPVKLKVDAEFSKLELVNFKELNIN